MKNTNKLIVHTNLYSKIALEVLQSVEGQLSDGIWENSPAMEKYWRFSNVTTAPDGEVVIEISKEYNKCTGVPSRYPQRGWPKWIVNGFNGWSGDQVLEWFAAKVKHIMQVELKDEDIKKCWKRTNDTFETRYLSYDEKITVSDVYFIYDFLMDRDTAGKYSISQHQKIKGEPKPEDQVKAEETRRANLAKLEAEWCEARNALEATKRERIKKLEEEFAKSLEFCNAKYKKLHDELV